MESLERRLPVYLLLDCSESMVGEGIDGVNAGMRQLLLDLHSDPHALETVWISIISFAGEAKQSLPLSEMIGIRAPKLKVQPGTALGGALRLLRASIAREVRTHSATTKGDWKPLVFLLSDGEPTDEARKLKQPAASGGKKLNFIAIGCGEDANPLVLNEIGDSVLMMGEDELDFRAAFQWISSSLSASSQQLASPTGAGGLSLAKIPADVFSAPTIPSGARLSQPKAPSQLFLALRCSSTRSPYLTRYGFEGKKTFISRAELTSWTKIISPARAQIKTPHLAFRATAWSGFCRARTVSTARRGDVPLAKACFARPKTGRICNARIAGHFWAAAPVQARRSRCRGALVNDDLGGKS